MRPEEVVTVFAGTAGSLVCVGNGEPTPSISWFRNGMEIRNGSFPSSVTIFEQILNETDVQSILEVCTFDASFGGNFSCQALNNFGNETVMFQLLVSSGKIMNQGHSFSVTHSFQMVLER